MSEFLKDMGVAVLKEVAKVLKENDGRSLVITLTETYYDKLIVQVDLPGPDAVVAPVIRKAIAPVVGAVYDKIMEKAAVLAA